MSVLWSAADLAAATGGRLTIPFEATGVAIDTRSLQPGDLFVALRGDNGDGHDHIAAALARGAAGALVHDAPAEPSNTPLLQVADTARALTGLGAAGRARFDGPVIAVTGSVGKTTTKEMLRRCLSQGAPAHAAEASHNNHWGVPLTLARLPRNAAACVVEIGMNHAGEIAPLSRLASPTLALITTVAASHIGHLGTLEAIADEKAAIAAGLRDNGVAILPADSPLLARIRAAMTRQVLTFGTVQAADAVLLDLRPAPDHSLIEVSIAGLNVRFRLNAPGRHMALNAVAALLATHAAGMDINVAARALASFTPGAGRGFTSRIGLPTGGTALLLDESYNASAASIRAALDVLALQPACRRIVVLGDMRELGDHSAAEHRGLAAPVARTADILFTCGPEMRHLHEAVSARLDARHADTAAALAPLVAAELRAGDAVLVKGSNASRMRDVIAALPAAPNAAAA